MIGSYRTSLLYYSMYSLEFELVKVSRRHLQSVKLFLRVTIAQGRASFLYQAKIVTTGVGSTIEAILIRN